MEFYRSEVWPVVDEATRGMFAVDDIDDTVARLCRDRQAELVGEIVQYQESYLRLCYIRGPEGLLIGLEQELSS